MSVQHPITHTKFYFLDKNLPFGASSSCLVFQKFSDCLQHLIEKISGKKFQYTNYLNDYLFVKETELSCNRLVKKFEKLCKWINCPLSQDKTYYATQNLVFLGILLDMRNFVLCLPVDKVNKALSMIQTLIAERKITMKNIQTLTRTLNFLSRAVIPGWAFTRRMYSKLTTDHKSEIKRILKPHHRITLDSEFLEDCRMWEVFLSNADSRSLCRPFIDMEGVFSAEKLNFYTDTLGSIKRGGFGAFLNGKWIYGCWERQFMEICKPNIEFLELYALCLGIFAWEHQFSNCQIIMFCDNKSVSDMVNSTSSHCKYCMKLIRLLTLNCIWFNRKVYILYVESHKNVLANALSRGNFVEFWKNAPANTQKFPDKLPEHIWPVSKFWKWF